MIAFSNLVHSWEGICNKKYVMWSVSFQLIKCKIITEFVKYSKTKIEESLKYPWLSRIALSFTFSILSSERCCFIRLNYYVIKKFWISKREKIVRRINWSKFFLNNCYYIQYVFISKFSLCFLFFTLQNCLK